MNEVGVCGKLTLQSTDLRTNESTEVEICNLVTNYGLGRIFAAKEPGAAIANRIYIGYKEEAANVTDDVIPSDWQYIPITATLVENHDNYSSRTTNYTVKNKFTAVGVIGNPDNVTPYLANHAYLAYVGEDGIPHAITSFRIHSTASWSLVYHKFTIDYNLMIGFPALLTTTGVTNLKVDPVLTTPTIPLNALLTENAFRPAGVSTPATDNFAIPLESTWDDATNTFSQKYKIIVNNVSANTSQRYWFGTCMVGFTAPSAGEYEVTISVNRVDLTVDATAVTAVSKYDSSRLRITGAPFQRVLVWTLDLVPVLLGDTYIGTDGYAVLNGYTTYFNKGKTYKFETIASNGTRATVDKTTPDESADPLIAFYRSGANTFRAIGNNGDKVEIMIWRSMTPSSVLTITTSGAIGTCNIPSTDEPGYYYCDITVDPAQLAPEECYDVRYKNTDAANNVYTDSGYRLPHRLMYIPDMPYAYYKNGTMATANTSVSELTVNKSNGIVLEIMEFNCEII